MWKRGALGGAVMPEDVRPDLDKGSEELARYFTLGMTLNYQRDSYALWRACTATYRDTATAWVFDPLAVSAAAETDLRAALLRHKVALQPNRHPDIWRRNGEGLLRHSGGDVSRLFADQGHDIARMKGFLEANRSSFPYLSGPKISNYWLYVLSQYLTWPLTNRSALSVAPDTHVIAASRRLGLLAEGEAEGARLVLRVAELWRDLTAGSEFAPIDLHTPLWLWSRGGFVAIEHLKEG